MRRLVFKLLLVPRILCLVTDGGDDINFKFKPQPTANSQWFLDALFKICLYCAQYAVSGNTNYTQLIALIKQLASN